MVIKVLYIISFMSFQLLLSQKAEPVYYDKDWKVTSKANASYYRLMPKKGIGELVLLQDFYISGTPQFEGYVFKKDENIYVGDVVWYDEYGNDENFRQYRNDTKNATLLYYYENGKIRKKVQYKNGVKDGETIIYSQDGAVLTKGIYSKGKPESGSFERVRNNDDYESNERVEETGSPDTIESSVVPPPPPPSVRGETEPQTTALSGPMNGENFSEKIKNRKTVTEKIFWINSGQIAQEKVFVVDGYYFRPVGQKNYDRSGKLIQALNTTDFEEYGSQTANGLEYDFYLRNNFATEIRSIIKYVGKLRSGKNFSYFPNGKTSTETLYKEGSKEGEEIVYDESGTLKSKRVYKDNEPFQGNFDETAGELNINLNYINGLKEGEAVATNQEKQIVAMGVYRNGKPFNGTFIEHYGDRSDGYELINVENFEKTGLQKVFGYRLEDIEKTYILQNEKLNGIMTFYRDGQPAATLEYKNDEPYEGTLIGDQETSVYKNGKIAEEIIYADGYGIQEKRIQKQIRYENGTPVSIKDYSFTITEQPQDFYEGMFRNGKPFSGYFETDASREFKQVDYLENGTPKFQYSNDYLKNMENYSHQHYDIKSTYKDGKIADGVEYAAGSKQFISRYWKGGVLSSFDWDLFAVNYFNRIRFELKDNEIKISDMQLGQSAVIKIDISQKEYKKQLMIDGKTVDVKSNNSKEKKQKLILYFREDGKIVSKTKDLMNEPLEAAEGTEMFYRVYDLVPEAQSVQEVFTKLSEKVIANQLMDETEGKTIVTGVSVDPLGNPKDGILISPRQNNTYMMQFHLNGKLIRSVDQVPFGKIEEEIKKLERMQ
jgi:uncharacterized protein